MLIFRVKAKKKEPGKGFKINIERTLFLSFIVTFLILILVQAALMNPQIRTYLAVDSEYEGTPLGLDEYLYEEGDLSLQLLNSEENDKIRVLVNGDVAAAFTDNEINIRVREGDIVEIDGSLVPNETEVGIVAKNGNISSDLIGKKVKVKKERKKLVRVEMN